MQFELMSFPRRAIVYCKKTNEGEGYTCICLYTSICPSLVFRRASAENSWKSPMGGAAIGYIYRRSKVESSLPSSISSSTDRDYAFSDLVFFVASISDFVFFRTQFFCHINFGLSFFFYFGLCFYFSIQFETRY